MSSDNQAIKNLLSLVLDAVSVAVQAEADGKISMADAGLVLKLVPDLGPAFAAIGDVPKELAALDEAMAADLIAFAMTKLSIENVKAQAVVGAGLKFAAASFDLFKAIKA